MKRICNSPTNGIETSDENKVTNAFLFRTNELGYIPLRLDYQGIFETASQHLDSYFLQTRDQHTRLVCFARPTPLNYEPKLELLSSLDQRLSVRPNSETFVQAKIEYCECCGSPGRIEFREANNGSEFLQICAPESLPLDHWASFVKALLQRNQNVDHVSDSQPDIGPKYEGEPFHFHPDTFSAFLRKLILDECALEISHFTRHTSHRRWMLPQSVLTGDDFSYLSSNHVSIEFLNESISHTLVESKSLPLSAITLVNTDDQPSIRIEPAADEPSQETFRKHLQRATQ